MNFPNAAQSQRRVIRDKEAHVWQIRLAYEVEADKFIDVLDQEERSQAAAFVYEVDRLHYVQSHAALRLILALYLNRDARTLAFERCRHQKPHLKKDVTEPDLHFNLSHTHGYALLATRLAAPVGVDIERRRELPDAKRLAARWFSRAENEALAALSRPAFHEAFLDLWTHREAVLKALGTDLETGLLGLACAFDSGGSVRLLSWQGDAEIVRPWMVARLSLDTGYVGALASLTRFWPIRYFEWSAAEAITGR